MNAKLTPLLVLCVAACSSATTNGVDMSSAAGGAALALDNAAYSFDPEGEAQRLDIEYVYTNRTGRVVHVARCGSTAVLFALEKQVGGAWVKAFDPICPMILVEPYAVESGEVLEGEVVIELVPGAEPQLQVSEVPGTYRLLLSIHDGWDPDPGELGELLAVEARASDPFTLEE